jgi:hypothetical protein
MDLPVRWRKVAVIGSLCSAAAVQRQAARRNRFGVRLDETFQPSRTLPSQTIDSPPKGLDPLSVHAHHRLKATSGRYTAHNRRCWKLDPLRSSEPAARRFNQPRSICRAAATCKPRPAPYRTARPAHPPTIIFFVRRREHQSPSTTKPSNVQDGRLLRLLSPGQQAMPAGLPASAAHRIDLFAFQPQPGRAPLEGRPGPAGGIPGQQRRRAGQ